MKRQNHPMLFLGISGSLRHGSFNSAALRAACELVPSGVTMQIVGIGDLPLYDDDVRLAGYPPAVAALRDAVARADALVLAVAEYNYSVSGVLKNAIDWLSRPPDPPLDEKPVAILGASTGNYGTARAQYHLRQMFVFTNSHPLNRPEVLITRAAEKFDAQGRLIDDATREVIRAQMTALAAWTARLRH